MAKEIRPYLDSRNQSQQEARSLAISLRHEVVYGVLKCVRGLSSILS